jgi:hypothetical protein
MQDLAQPPATLHGREGVLHEGAFAGTIPDASLDGGLLKKLRKKTWRYAGVFRDDLALGVAICDVGYMGLAFAYVAEGSRVVERGWRSPGAVGMAAGAANGASAAVAPGRLIALATTRDGGITVGVDMPGIRANIDIEGDSTPLTVVSDLGHGDGAHGLTVKNAGMLARGTIVVEGRSYTLSDARGCTDWTEAFFPRRTTWNWATAGGVSPDGQVVGFNLAVGVHDDTKGRFNENALWLNGHPSALPPVTFTVSPGETPWAIHSQDGSVDLVFEPRGERREEVNLYVVSSHFRQAFGAFTGKLRDARGREVRIEGVPGVAEEHDAVW